MIIMAAGKSRGKALRIVAKAVGPPADAPIAIKQSPTPELSNDSLRALFTIAIVMSQLSQLSPRQRVGVFRRESWLSLSSSRHQLPSPDSGLQGGPCRTRSSPAVL